MIKKICVFTLVLSLAFGGKISFVDTKIAEKKDSKCTNNSVRSIMSTQFEESDDILRTDEAIVEDELIVQFDAKTPEKEIDKAIENIADDYEVLSGEFEIDDSLPQKKKSRLKKYLSEENYNTIICVDLKDNVNIEEVKEELEDNVIVEEASYNHEMEKVQSYGVDDTYSDEQYYLSKINAKTAWNTYSRSGYAEIWVSVIDTGLYVNNKDFSGIYLKKYSVDITSSESGNYKKLSDMSKPDPNGHGTNIAGIIAAKGDNAFQTVGVASGWINDSCKIMAIKASRKGDSGKEIFTDKDLIKAIQYSIEHGAEVINMSLGDEEYNSEFQKAINNAYNAGVTVVAAKGNHSDKTKFYPADYNHVISVSATDKDNKLSEFSNYGTVDICAPGEYIYGSSRSTGDKPIIMSGTSQATAIVSATVALMRGMNYDLTTDQIESTLYDTANNIGSITKFGHGLVDTGYAVQKVKYMGLRAEKLNLKSITETVAGNVKLKWNELYNAEGYCILRATSENGTYSRIAVVDDDSLSYIDKTVKSGKRYFYKVIGYMKYTHGTGTVSGNSVGYSKYSNIQSLKLS